MCIPLGRLLLSKYIDYEILFCLLTVLLPYFFFFSDEYPRSLKLLYSMIVYACGCCVIIGDMGYVRVALLSIRECERSPRGTVNT